MRECFGVNGVIDYHPKTEMGCGYSLTFEHVKETLGPVEKPKLQEKEVEMIAAHYSITKTRFFGPDITHTFTFSARRKNFNLILKQTHHFSLSSNLGNRGNWPSDILNFPLRICAHHTTDTASRKDKASYAYHWDHRKQVYGHKTCYNTPMLTHAITTAFPIHKRIATSSFFPWLPFFSQPKFAEPAISEENQMNAANEVSPEEGLEHVWWSHSCPTKFKISHNENGKDVTATVWQSIGRNEKSSRVHWRAFCEEGEE